MDDWQCFGVQARPAPGGHPFQPSKSDRLLTVPDDIVLSSDERSKQRAEFDAAVAERARQQKVGRPVSHQLLTFQGKHNLIGLPRSFLVRS